MNFIKVERAKRGMRQSDLADLTEIPASKLYRAEKRNNMLDYLSYNELEQLANGFDMTIDELVNLYRKESVQ